jgi:hypothetical protein
MNYDTIPAFEYFYYTSATQLEYCQRVEAFLAAKPDFNSYTIPEPPTAPCNTTQFTNMLPVDSTVSGFHFNPPAPYVTSTNEPFGQHQVENIRFDAEPIEFNPYITPPSTPPLAQSDNEPNMKLFVFSAQKAISKPRPKRGALRLRYSNFKKRLNLLRADPLVKNIIAEKNKVQCAGCKKYIQLDNRKPKTLHIQNWKTHKGRCVWNKNQVKASLTTPCSTVSDSFFYYLLLTGKS